MDKIHDSKFYSSLAKLNEDFVDLVVSTHKKGPYYDYTQTCKDYIDLVAGLEREHPAKEPRFENSTTRTEDNGFSSNSTPFTNNNIDKNEADDDDEALPPEPQAERYNEPDSIHSVKCKMYHKDKTGYDLKGIGMLFIKKSSANNHQIIIRAEPDLRKILFNVMMSPSLPIRRQQKTVQLVCPNNAETKDTLTVALKLKTEDDAITLIEKLEKIKKSA